MKNLLKQTREFIQAKRLVSPDEHLLAAVSGGRDSCVMLHILHSLSVELGFSLSVAHFDHQLRPESGVEQLFVRELAASYNLPFSGGQADVAALSGGVNIEDTARRARYAFLRQTASELGAAKIATAHHAQDQAETVLLHLTRGSGLEGLAAISTLENGLMRPILFALPAQIEDYRAQHDLRFCQDESNADPRYLRNHIRLHILPQLLEINPRLVEALAATADICREDNALLNAWAKVALDELWRESDKALADGFFALPPALQRRIMRQAFTRVAGSAAELSFAQTETASSLKEEQSVSLPGGWLAYRRGGLYIGREQPPLPIYEETLPLLADGNWHQLAAWGWEYRVMQNAECRMRNCGGEEYSITLPADMAEGLVFRTRREGDCVPSQGRAGRRKVKEIFIKAKIPPQQRAGWPILLHGQDICWLPGLYSGYYPAGGAGIMIIARHFSE